MLDENTTKEKRIILWIIAIALFMETLDVTIISTAIPQIALNLQTNPISLKFALTSYLISLSIFIPASGWFADKFGTKIIFASAVGIFIIGSIFCGISTDLITLIVARIIQGVGGAMMMPVGRLILLRTFSKQELIKANNYVTIPSLIGPAIGPVLGGGITAYMSWRWIFYINIPFGLLGLYLILKYAKNHKNEAIPPFDTIGFILFGLGVAGLSFWFESIGENILSLPTELIIMVISLLCLVLYVINSKNHTHPLIDASLFKIRTFKITIFGSLCSRLGLGGMPFLLPLFFQSGFNLPPLQSGLLIFPLAIGMMLMKCFVSTLLKLFGFKKTLIVNTILLGFSIIQFVFIDSQTSYVIILIMIFIHGLLISLQFSCMNILSYVDLNSITMSKATSIASVIQQLSMGAGVALSALFLRCFITANSSFSIEIFAFHKTFLVIGLITLFSSTIFCKLHGEDGHTASGHM